ncbi:MAG TPA: tetratricopeptide repeat protein, partial [Candidatus Angelobacter sp.]|nr:tetratricopeptide repeat protein [Candidatus Angelobacter sp.]
GVNSFLDFLLRILRAVCDEENTTIPESLNDLARIPEGNAEARVWHCLQERLGTKTLFLIIENLDSIFKKIGEQGQRQWRALIQTNPQWTILATTPALFSGISLQVSPFYGFFEVIHLQPLTLEEAIDLLKKLAALNQDERTVAFLDTAVGRARVRAVQHLAGGNHRIFVLFYDFLNQSGSEQFVIPLLKTVDALTPYYQAQMDRLSPQQQKIVAFLCEYRRPATVTTIATNCFTTHQTAASQLKQLLSNRYLRVDRIGREAFYELTEPLLRICVEAKTHHERPLNLLVDFIRYWFSREELEHKLSGTSDRDPGKRYIMAALKEYDAHNTHVHVSSAIADLCSALSQGTDSTERLRSCAQELAELSKIAEDWFHYTRGIVWQDKGAEAVPVLQEQIEKDPDNISLLRCLASAYGSAGKIDRAHECIDRAIALSPNRGILFFDKARILTNTDRRREALEAYDQAAFLDSDLRLRATLERASTLVGMGEFKAARETLEPLLSKGDVTRGVFFLYGLALAHEENHAEALKYFAKAVRSFERDAAAWGNKGIALCALGRYEEAFESLSRALTLDPEDKNFLHYYCESLFEMKRYDMAVQTASPEILSHNIFHSLLKVCSLRPKQGKLQQELVKLKKASESAAWQNAFVGGLTEFAGFAAEKLTSDNDLTDLQTWNSALRELFDDNPNFAILLTLFEVLVRVRVFNDRKALLELPREQRLLIMSEKNEEDFLNDR